LAMFVALWMCPLHCCLLHDSPPDAAHPFLSRLCRCTPLSCPNHQLVRRPTAVL
jgi:hypothetical protein